ncbi:MAG: LysM peptidoglycan-binding domain-containing protein [Bacteroidota bacterium]
MRAGLLIVLVALSAVPASAQVSARLADLRLATAVRLALVADARTRPLDVSVTARGGAVTVDGAPSAERSVVQSVAREVAGVRSVNGAGDRSSGPVVTIPQRESPPAGRQYHTVERGDTLFSLARRYGTTVAAIIDLNGMRSSAIQIGQRLRVR